MIEMRRNALRLLRPASLLAEYTSGGTGWTQFLRFNGEPVAMVRSGAISFIHSDQRGRMG